MTKQEKQRWDEFWRWIAKKDINIWEDIKTGAWAISTDWNEEKILISFTKQMIVAYMQEYLIEKHGKPIKFVFANITKIDQIYEILEHKIKTGNNLNMEEFDSGIAIESGLKNCIIINKKTEKNYLFTWTDYGWIANLNGYAIIPKREYLKLKEDKKK